MYEIKTRSLSKNTSNLGAVQDLDKYLMQIKIQTEYTYNCLADLDKDPNKRVFFYVFYKITTDQFRN